VPTRNLLCAATASIPIVLRVIFGEVERVLDALASHGVRHWVGGGWGVAALAGVQTREHRDLDLAVDAEDLTVCLQTLERLGYRRETDWLPVRVEYAAPGRGWVDVHPVGFDDSGHGRQQDLDGGHFDYPPDGFTVGAVRGRAVPCLSAGQQRRFHAGYEPRPQDMHDLEQLAALDD
jgi:lincosamide nucleotidyltransferase A/C/D/E